MREVWLVYKVEKLPSAKDANSRVRELGRVGLTVSAIGFGCMGIGFVNAHKPSNDEGIAVKGGR